LRKCAPAISLERLHRVVDLFAEQNSQLALDPSFERTHESADPAKVEIFDVLAAYRNARLIEVVTHDHLYFAAIHSGAVQLTPLGRHYWRLVKENRL
jgi:hypothetical protein